MAYLDKVRGKALCNVAVCAVICVCGLGIILLPRGALHSKGMLCGQVMRARAKKRKRKKEKSILHTVPYVSS